MTDKQYLITSAIDSALAFSEEYLQGLLHTVYTVPDYMVDNSKKAPTQDWCYWKALKADIKSSEFDEYETKTGIRLPDSYIMFLGHKYFIDLNFGHDVIFIKHTKNWIADYLEFINQWGTDTTIKKGLLPFADMSDWGIVCFDSNRVYSDDEYNIVYLDHEDKYTPKEFKYGQYTFVELVKDMTRTLENWRQTKLNGG